MLEKPAAIGATTKAIAQKVANAAKQAMQRLASVRNTAKVEGETCVYSCVVDGTTRYVGITNDAVRRGAEHMRDKGIKITDITGLDNLSRVDARAVEQTLINYYGLGKTVVHCSTR